MHIKASKNITCYKEIVYNTLSSCHIKLVMSLVGSSLGLALFAFRLIFGVFPTKSGDSGLSVGLIKSGFVEVQKITGHKKCCHINLDPFSKAINFCRFKKWSF